MKFSNLFSPINIGSLQLKNRIVSSPVTSNFAEKDGTVNKRLLSYFSKRAQGGVGLVIVEGAYICLEGKGYIGQIGISEDRFIPGLKELAATIKKQGAKASIQIQHCGRRSSSKITGLKPVAPSPIPYSEGADTPKEMTEEDIWLSIKQFAEAAGRAKEAGFDAVDIHAAHGYLPAAFLSLVANKRTDKWGGSLENRARYLQETIKSIKQTVGSDFPVSVKFSADEYLEGGITIQDTLQIIKLLEDAGADAFQVSAGAPGGKNLLVLEKPHTFMRTLPMGTAPGCLVDLAEEVKKNTSLPIVALGRISDPELADSIIEQKKADLVSLGRPLLADPFWPQKVEEGKIEDIKPCISCNEGCYSKVLKQEDITCAVNPEIGKEYLNLNKPAASPKTVVVVGGGPAGMEAALVASKRGHRVTLVEKNEQLGGQLNYAYVPPDRGEIKKLLDYYIVQLKKSAVKVLTNTALTMQLLEEIQPDEIIVATGSVPAVPGIVQGGSNVFTAHEVLANKPDSIGKKVLVAGGGLVGCETAEYLAEFCDQVILVEMMDEIAKDAAKEDKVFLELKLEKLGVSVYTSTKIVSVKGREVYLEDQNGQKSVEVDSLVVALGAKPNHLEIAGSCLSLDDKEIQVNDKKVKVHYAGDCKAPRKIIQAIAEGYEVAVNI